MIKEANKIHFIGIGGIGVSAIARLCLGMGKQVSGSDLRDSQTVQDLILLGAKIDIGHSVANIEANSPDLVVYSEDISPGSKGHVELEKANDLNIPSLTYAKALGELMSGQLGVAVTGTNGKSTTTALLGLILEAANMDPTVVVGSKLSQKNTSEKFTVNARLGTGKYFVAEADEYHRHMMELVPEMIVITNVGEDHLDYYKDLQEIKSAFEQFVLLVPKTGTVIYNADDHSAVEVGRTALCHKFTFGIKHYADLQALNIKTEAGRQSFDLHYKDQMIGRLEISIPGRFNVSNVLAATLAALKLGVEFEVIQRSLQSFAGIWRRFENIGQFNQVLIVSDYAHHPDAVAGTIAAAKEFYPGKKILFVFQPHHRNRTKKLFGEFVEALAAADDLLLLEVFDVVGREHGEVISSKPMIEELIKQKVRAAFVPDLNAAETVIRKTANDYDVIVMMGAGDIDLVARKLVTKP